MIYLIIFEVIYWLLCGFFAIIPENKIRGYLESIARGDTDVQALFEKIQARREKQ